MAGGVENKANIKTDENRLQCFFAGE